MTLNPTLVTLARVVCGLVAFAIGLLMVLSVFPVKIDVVNVNGREVGAVFALPLGLLLLGGGAVTLLKET